MLNIELVPLSTIDGFTPGIRAKLQTYWITSAQEFLDILVRPLGSNLTGETFLRSQLGLDENGMNELYAVAKAAVPAFSFDATGEDEEVVGGCLFDEADLALPLSYAAGEPPPDTLLGPPAWPAEDQGRRNTCVAFTSLAMYRVLAQSGDDLSEQFLFWAAKEYEDPNDARGLLPASAFKALQERGVCLEEHWPYNPNPLYRQPPMDENVPQGPPPQPALDNAPRRRILSYQTLNPRDIDAIREEIYRGHPVLIGMPYHRYWAQGWQGRMLGRIRPPMTGGEELTGGHAMCALGFRADPEAPGGGYFVVRNSWGTKCGAENEDGIGYCHIPYSLISDYNLAAYSITLLADASAVPVSHTAPSETDMAEPVGSAPGEDLAEAQALLARIQADVAQLSALLAKMAGGQ